MDTDFLLDVASQAVLQQVMNHRDAGIFQAYLNERVRCDVQAAFLGRPSADALIKATGHISRLVDPRAPVGLTDSQVNSLKTNPRVVEYRTIQKAKGTKLHELYQDLSCASIFL